jgi:hypothetical protein
MESNHVRDLMEAYSSIYAENEEVEQLDEDFQGAVERTLAAGAKETDKFMKTPVGKVIRPFVSPVGKGQGTVTADQQKAKIIQKQSFDLFDIIKGHLLDEGFADTEEAALAIMTNMSEEWREQILDEAVRGSGRSIGDIITGDDIRGVTRGKKPVYKKPKWKDDVENKVDREVQLLSDRKNKKKSEMAAGRLTVATKRGIEKATNRSNDGPGGDEFAPGSALRRREEDDQPTDYRARKRRASGR